MAIREFALIYQNDVSWLDDQCWVKPNQGNLAENPGDEQDLRTAWSAGTSSNPLTTGASGAGARDGA